MTKSILEAQPVGMLRVGLRLPIWLYRLGLGWLLDDRFLMLTHIGRHSGKPRQTVVEVVKHDPKSNDYYVVSGWGNKADWYRNIHKHPDVIIHAGWRTLHAHAEDIPFDEAVAILDEYTRLHPMAFKELTRIFLNEQLQPGPEVTRRLIAMMPMVVFRPHD